LLPSFDVSRLLDLCAVVGSAPLPDIYHVADGFLLKVHQPTEAVYPGAIRLRGLADNLLVPADAELVPALHDDEARGLVRARGLVFLPGGRVLAFAPQERLPLSAMIQLGGLRRRAWQSFPEPMPLPDRIRQFALVVPHPPADEILEEGGADIGTEDPRPDDSSLPSKVLGHGGVLAGKGMMGLGKLFGSKKLADYGANLIKKSLAMAPRVSEAVFGRQEAALRALLREFREGSLERALRRALPMGGVRDRGSVPSGGFRLPFHNLIYSLRNILGSSSGPAQVWLGGRDVQAELVAEYRKAAERAAAAGDYRRAAYIYGRLLADYRAAATVLQQGGLCHDAAVILLEKVGDVAAAARAYEAAGEVDRAVELYLQVHQHLQAGDVLRRAGEDEAALAEYQIVANEVVATRGDYHAAGELMLVRAARPDLAQGYFEKGWAQRPGKSDLPCALALAKLYAEREPPQRLLSLLDEAEPFFAPPCNDVVAGRFFNEVARLAHHPNLTDICDELRDRMLLALAGKLGQRVAVERRPGNVVSDLLGQWGVWDAPVVSDAKFAVHVATRRSSTPDVPGTTTAGIMEVTINRGRVTAAAFAAQAGHIFLGFESGEIWAFRPAFSGVIRLPSSRPFPVLSLATDSGGELVVALDEPQPGAWAITSYAMVPEGGYQVRQHVDYAYAAAWLSPLVVEPSRQLLTGVWRGDQLGFLSSPLLVACGALEAPPNQGEIDGALLLPSLAPPRQATAVLLFGSNRIWYGEDLVICSGEYTPEPNYEWEAHTWYEGDLGWTPVTPEGSPLQGLPVAWLRCDHEHLELAALTANGTVRWSSLQLQEGRLAVSASNGFVRAEGYLAATLVRPGLVAAVSRSHIDWLLAGGRGFTRWATTPAHIPLAVACFASAGTSELIVVCRNGVVVRVPVPN
jgi:tetratricopeptide (TPR) repeat protein